MENRRPAVVLATCAVVAAIGFVLAAVFDEQKGWNHAGQAVANISWILMLAAVLGVVVSGGTLIVKAFAHRR
jgi:hypothetical protein